MKKSIAKQLEELHHQIQSRDFVQEAHSTPEWGGADVIISSHMSDRIRNWLEDAPFVISPQKSVPRRRAVITHFSRELSWLFDRLRDVYKGTLDHISKYDFYGRLARSALDYIEANKEHIDCTDLLYAVLQGVETTRKTG